MDLHVLPCNTNLFKRSVINMDIQLHNKVPVSIKKLNSYKSFKRELKYFRMNQVFYSIVEFLCYWLDDLQLHILKFYMIYSISWLFWVFMYF
jgi:hypothetical protein